jgi:phospholipid/cholesterol/gamma-HCH transport system substrate-binding protein
MRAGLVSQLTDQGGRLLAQLEETSRRVNQLLDAENQKVLMGGIASLGHAAAGFAPVLREAGNTLQTFRSATQMMTESLVEVKKASTEISQMALRVQQPGGTLEQFSQGVTTMNNNLLALQTDTLPRLNQLLDEAARTTRAVGRSASALNDNPQALIFGYPVRPGPGEPGFSPSSNKP